MGHLSSSRNPFSSKRSHHVRPESGATTRGPPSQFFISARKFAHAMRPTRPLDEFWSIASFGARVVRCESIDATHEASIIQYIRAVRWRSAIRMSTARATRSARHAERARQHPHRPVPVSLSPHATVKELRNGAHGDRAAGLAASLGARMPPFVRAPPYRRPRFRPPHSQPAPTSPKPGTHERRVAGLHEHRERLRPSWPSGPQPPGTPSTLGPPDHRTRTSVRRRRRRSALPPLVHRPRVCVGCAGLQGGRQPANGVRYPRPHRSSARTNWSTGSPPATVPPLGFGARPT